MKRSNKQRYAAQAQSHKLYDPHNMGVLDAIGQAYPAFAKHLFDGNEFLATAFLKQYTAVDLLEMPLCNHCEKLAAWMDPDEDGSPRAGCFARGCGKVSVNPITLLDYVQEACKKTYGDEVSEVMAAACNLAVKKNNRHEMRRLGIE